jgi:hypothetical protein
VGLARLPAPSRLGYAGAAMAKLNLTHVINCDVDTFWKTFFDREYNDKLYLGALGFPEFKVTSQTENDKEIVRVCEGEPKMTVPAPVAKLLGNSFKYKEDGRFDKATKTWTWKLTPSTLADKIRNEGKLRVEAAGDGKCKRICEIVIEAKIFGVGGMIESSSEKQLSDGWDASARFMNDVWFKK